MLRELKKRIYAKLQRFEFFARVFNTLKRTPTYAVHWYLLMLFGLVIVLTNVGLAWFVFSDASNTGSTLEQSVIVTTINRDELKKVLDIYRARVTEVEQLQAVPPRIVDPGR